MLLPLRDGLIGRIYDTLLDPGDWTGLLEAISDWSSAAPLEGASADAQQQMEGLLEHMQRAVRGSGYLHMLEDQNQLLNRLYNSMPWPMLMLAEDLSVVSCNPSARQALSQGSAIQLLGDGRLAVQDAQLRQELRSAAMAGKRKPQILTLASEALTLLCIPFGKSAADGEIVRVRMIVWVLASRDVVVPSPEDLRSIFRLSQAESRLLHLLCRIGSLNQCADLLGLSTHTVRAQLKSAMAKVGVNSQVQLVSQAMGHTLLHAARQADSAAENTMTLDDGRVLSWYEYGHPKGRAVLALENIGSSIPDHAQFENWYREQRLRVIVPVRPGYGISTARRNLQFRDFAADLRALCRHLRIERPAIAAYCCGGAYALASAAVDPQLFSRVGVLGSTVPIEHFELDKLDRLHRMFLELFRRDPRLFLMIGKLALRGVQHAPEKYFRFLAEGLKARDQALLSDPVLVASIVRQMRQRHFQGALAQAEEYLNLQFPWGVALDAIRVPTLVWHGQDDAIISIGSARAMAASMPAADFRCLPGHGHFLVYDVWKDFLTALLELRSAPKKPLP